MMMLTVGKLAKRTGLTVRALHHYDAIGLLTPSGRSDSGYRLYSHKDITRLYRIQSLQRLGFSLAEIGTVLARDATTLPQIIEQHMACVERQIAQAKALYARLGSLRDLLLQGDEPNLADWLTTLELMSVYDKYFTTDELSEIRTRAADVRTEWPPLIAAMRDVMERHVPPDSAEVQALVERWMNLLGRTVGTDTGLQMKWDEMHRQEPALQDRSGVDIELLSYLHQAIGHRRLAIYARHLPPADLHRLRPEGRQQRNWPAVINALRRLADQGSPTEGAEAKALVEQWDALLNEFTGNDSDLREKVLQVAKLEPELRLGMSAEMLEFLGRARTAPTVQTA